MRKIDLKNIDRSNWQTYKFEDIAQKISKTVKPQEAEVNTYVGLEHLDGEDLHIRRKGVPSDVKGGKLRCYPGDIIFGKRRAYQRKAAIVDFDGICSAHAFVFRANPEVIDEEFFPFFLHSDQFMHRMVDISVGGLSPTINWGDLRHQEFLFPPKDQQAQLAKLLWAMDEVIEREKEVLEKLEISFLSNRKSFVENGVSQSEDSRRIKFGLICSKWKTTSLNKVCDLVGGNAFKSSEFKDNGQFQVLRIGNVTKNGFELSKTPVFINQVKPKEEKYFIPKGAVVMSLTGTNGKRDYGFPSLMTEDNKYLLNQRLVMLISNPELIIPEFLHIVSKMEFFQAKFFLNATGTANQANVSISDVSEIEIPIPSLKDQKEIVNRMNYFKTSGISVQSKISSSQALQKSLINQIFS